jgi:hypothetical protein
MKLFHLRCIPCHPLNIFSPSLSLLLPSLPLHRLFFPSPLLFIASPFDCSSFPLPFFSHTSPFNRSSIPFSQFCRLSFLWPSSNSSTRLSSVSPSHRRSFPSPLLFYRSFSIVAPFPPPSPHIAKLRYLRVPSQPMLLHHSYPTSLFHLYSHATSHLLTFSTPTPPPPLPISFLHPYSSTPSRYLSFFSSMYCVQHGSICRLSDSTVSEDAGIEPRTVASSALAVRRSNHSARSHPQSVRSHPHSVRSHPHSVRSHPHSVRSPPHSV